MRDAVKRGVNIGSAARVSGARNRFKIIPECVRETDLHPDPPAAALRTLNFPRAALDRGEEEQGEELTLRTFSFFSGRHLFPLLTKKARRLP